MHTLNIPPEMQLVLLRRVSGLVLTCRVALPFFISECLHIYVLIIMCSFIVNLSIVLQLFEPRTALDETCYPMGELENNCDQINYNVQHYASLHVQFLKSVQGMIPYQSALLVAVTLVKM